jgi:hypothetical protein
MQVPALVAHSQVQPSLMEAGATEPLPKSLMLYTNRRSRDFPLHLDLALDNRVLEFIQHRMMQVADNEGNDSSHVR